MNRALSYWLDIVVMVAVLAVSVTLQLPFYIAALQPPVSYIEDKTALDVNNAAYMGDSYKTGTDIVMGLMVSDEYTPYPRAIRINDNPIIKLDNAWISNKFTNINNIYNGGGQSLKLMMDWKITSVTFVQNGGNPYIQYRLENLP